MDDEHPPLEAALSSGDFRGHAACEQTPNWIGYDRLFPNEVQLDGDVTVARQIY